MYRRRSRLEIILTILSIVRDGVNKPTRIMYAANMSWNPVKNMLSHLVDQGLIEMRVNTVSRQSKRRYVITEKGVNVLDYFEKANELMTIDGSTRGD